MRSAALVWASTLVLTGLVLACSSDDTPPPPSAGGGSANEGGRPSSGAGDAAGSTAGEEPGGGAGAAEAGGAGGAGAGQDQAGGTGAEQAAGGSDPTEGGGSSTEGGAPPIIEPSTCELTAEWGAPEPLAGISTPDADETLLALSADERTLIFRRDDALLRAERASATDAWEPPVSLTLPSGYTADHALALSQDGLRLTLVREDRRAFGEVTRALRSEDFGDSVDATPFLLINDEGGYQNYAFGWPLVAASSMALYYVGVYGDSFVFPCPRSEAGWAKGSELYDASAGTAGNSRLITGLSADERTLFAYDEALGYVVSLWRDRLDKPFKLGPELPERLTALPNLSCQRLYATRVAGDSLDIVVETPQ